MLLTIVLAATLSSPSPLWGNLEPGPHAVGFTQWERRDHSRSFRTARDLEGRPRPGERARPIKMSIWYPARPSNAKPLTFGDYVDMIGGEALFGPISAEAKRAGEDALFAFPLLRSVTGEHRARLRALPSRAMRDAKPATGKFPLVVYSLGSTVIAHVTPEYLASHGYVVVQSPRLGAYAGLPADNRDALDLETKLRDMDFLIQEMKGFEQADLGSMATIGFSAGGRWALAAAMKNPDVKAVVALDSVMLFNDRQTEAWRRMAHFNLDAVRVPVLNMTRAAFARQEDPKMWEALRYADRTAIVFDDPALDHFDFQSLGFALALAGARGPNGPKVVAVFDSFHRNTLAFLDAHVKGSGTFRPAGEKITHLAAQPAPISVGEFMNALFEDGTDAAIRAYRRTWKERGEPPVPEATLNVAGYTLLFGGRVADGLELLTLNAEAFPTSANVYDSLADAYLAAGDRAKALDLTKKAAEMLEKDTSITAERKAAIKGSVDEKLKRLQEGGQ